MSLLHLLLYSYNQFRTIRKKEGIILSDDNNNINNNESLFTVIKYLPTINLTLYVIIEFNKIDFCILTLVNHLKESFDISTSRASLFFILSN